MANPTDALVQELLQERHIACLATENADESIHLTAVWYLFEEGRIYVATSSKSRKARNIRSRPKASLMIDARQSAAERGVAAAGGAELVSGKRSRELNLRIQSRYLSPAAMADPRVGGVLADLDDITIELVPTKWASWDMRELGKALFGGAPAPAGYFLPLD
jgi:nitroimidazol reductase NimA-like FMN-containing flavoprotein (pyridoxamine 5'-phosphate oxidase superfamily)